MTGVYKRIGGRLKEAPLSKRLLLLELKVRGTSHPKVKQDQHLSEIIVMIIAWPPTVQADILPFKWIRGLILISFHVISRTIDADRSFPF